MSLTQNTVFQETIMENYEMGYISKEEAIDQARQFGFNDLLRHLTIPQNQVPNWNGYDEDTIYSIQKDQEESDVEEEDNHYTE